jgi:hypothetical protein
MCSSLPPRHAGGTPREPQFAQLWAIETKRALHISEALALSHRQRTPEAYSDETLCLLGKIVKLPFQLNGPLLKHIENRNGKTPPWLSLILGLTDYDRSYMVRAIFSQTCMPYPAVTSILDQYVISLPLSQLGAVANGAMALPRKPHRISGVPSSVRKARSRPFPISSLVALFFLTRCRPSSLLKDSWFDARAICLR